MNLIKNRLFKITFLAALFFLFSISYAGSGPVFENPDYHVDNAILLKNIKIDTSIAQQSKTVQKNAISQYQIETDGYYIVQFKGYIKQEWKQALHILGAVLYDYVPNNAFIARMNSSVKSQVETLESVQWIGPYKSGYRISPALLSSPVNSGQKVAVENIMVLLFDAADNKRVSGEITGLGGEITGNSGDRIRVSIARTRIPDIARMNGVSWIEKYVQPVILNDVAANITEAYSVRSAHGLTGAGQIVAVADTGLDTGVNDNTMHADIRGKIVALHAWWSEYGDSGAEDNNGHGTHVSGSILGSGSRSNGRYAGMATEASIVFQAMQYDGPDSFMDGGFYIPNDLYSLFQEAYDDGAKIHSNSWGSGDPALYGDYTSDSQYVDSFMWDNRDMLIVFAAGNSGSEDNTVIPPGTAKNAISVGASENLRIENGIYADNINDIASFSSRGFTDDNRVKPDIVAPGTYIISTRSSKPDASYFRGVVDPYYAYNSGTSMAAPIVAGTAALVRQFYMNNESISPSAALVKATLINGAINMSLPENAQGWGRADIENSLFPSPPRIMGYHDNSVGLSTSQSWNVSYNVINSSEPLRVTLVWSDYPGTPFAGITLVNDLDLTVTGPGGTYYGNGAPDNRNNVEEAEILSPSAGLYTIMVDGVNIPEGPQPFALVISGALDISPPEASDEYPINGSYINNNLTTVAVNITDYGTGVNMTSFSMSTQGLPATVTNTSIPHGFRIQNVMTTPYNDGAVNVSINTMDNALNDLSYAWSFTVDTISPVITDTQIAYPSGFAAAKNGTTITMNISISDALAGVKNATVNASQINSSIGNIVLTNNSGSWDSSVIVNVSDGIYNLNVTAYDNAGNMNNTVQVTVIVDNTRPNVTINPVSYQRGTAAKTGSIIEFNISAVDPVINNTSSGMKNASMNVSMINNTGTIALTNSSGFWKGDMAYDTFASDNNYSVYFSFSDNAGNINSIEHINVTIDNTPPFVTDISFSSSFINLSDPIGITANITSPDSVSLVDGSQINADITYPDGTSVKYPMSFGSGNIYFKNFSDTAQYGRYYVTIIANDTTGNTNSTQQTQFSAARISNMVMNITEANTETLIFSPYSNTSLRLCTNNSSYGTIQISQSKVNLTSNTSEVNNPGIYILVNASQSLRDNLTYVFLAVNYSDADVSSFSEPSLRLHRWNTTSSDWEKLSGKGSPSFVNDAGVDTINNYVWANLTKLSEFTIGGDIYVASVQQAAASSGGGGGGGGGGTTDENHSNIEFIEKYDMQISKDATTSYKFANRKNPILFVNITGASNMGIITTSVEVLKDSSGIVKTPAGGLIYKNINIWVGTAGFATPKNIKEALIKFRVDNTWMSANNIAGSDIVLVKWDGSSWIQLETKVLSKDNASTYFEGKTDSFSPFAIVGTKEQQNMNNLTLQPEAPVEEIVRDNPKTDPIKKTSGFEVIIPILSLYAVCLFRRIRLFY